MKCNTVKLPGHPVKPMVPLVHAERRALHHGESRGYGKNPLGRDNRQPSSKGNHLPMSAVHRLNGSGLLLVLDIIVQARA